MVQTFLGIVERFNVGKFGPGARLRPLFQTSPDKKRWLKPEENFPNSGVVSWWHPLPDAEVYQAWVFQVDRSWTYEYDNEHHDYYKVRDSTSPAHGEVASSHAQGEVAPSLAAELVDLPAAADPEDTRSLLLEEGLPLDKCASKRLAFRDRSGSVVGPIELLLRDGRLFLDEKELPIAVNQWDGDLAVASWEGHQFLPLKVWPRRGGEVDYSPNVVFLKRILRDLREMSPQVIDNAKLIERLIGSYCTALEKISLTSLQKHRMKRLHKLAEQVHSGVTLTEDTVTELLSLPDVKDVLTAAKQQAVRSAVEEHHTALNELEKERARLKIEVATLRTEAARLHDEMESSHREQAAVLGSFDECVQKKFETISQDTSSFLADVAVVRAALSGPVTNRSTKILVDRGEAQTVAAAEVASSLREHFDKAGLGCVLPVTLLASWASGYVPMAFGVMAREALVTAGDCLFGGRLHVATLGPTLSSPMDLLRLHTASSSGTSSVEELLSDASRSEDLFLLVFDNINLCQLDSTLVPLLRNYAGIHGQPSNSRFPVRYATSAGIWPSNVLFSGIMLDSPLALPMSRELWTCSTFIDASGKRTCAKGKGAEAPRQNLTYRLSYATWSEWLETIDYAVASDARMLTAHVSREIEASAVYKRLLRRLAAAVDHTGLSVEENKRAGLVAEMAVIPYLLSRGVNPEAALKDSPAEVWLEGGFVDMVTGLFGKWGLELRRESSEGGLYA